MTTQKIHPVLAARFQHNVRAIRDKRAMTRPMLADLMGISSEYLYQLETGRACPSLEMVERCAVALTVDPSRLLKETT